MYKVITNNIPREILYGHELPEEQRKEFDWMDDNDFYDSSFVKYRGRHYALSEFMRWNQDKEWDGYISDSFFSAIMIRFCDDPDYVVMGLMLS